MQQGKQFRLREIEKSMENLSRDMVNLQHVAQTPGVMARESAIKRAMARLTTEYRSINPLRPLVLPDKHGDSLRVLPGSRVLIEILRSSSADHPVVHLDKRAVVSLVTTLQKWLEATS